jgi:uncharacterized repeat protein (TIGR01451 family)
VTSAIPDSVPDNNTITESTDYHSVNLGIQKSTESNKVVSGDTITYTLQITNAGPFHGLGVTVSDTLPAYVSFVTSSVPPLANEYGIITWYLETLEPSDKWTIIVTATVDDDAVGLLTNVARVTNKAPDVNSSNDCAQVHTMAPVPVVNTAYVCEGDLWCKKSNVVFNTPFDVHLSIILQDWGE